MDTKSTRFKYTKISKAICLLLATLLFSLGTWCAVELGIGCMTYGPQQYFANDAAKGRQSYTESEAFEQVLDEVIFIQNGHILLKEDVDQIRNEEGKSVDQLFREVFRW